MRRNAKLTEVKRLIMENLPVRNDQVGITRSSLLGSCMQDGASLQLLEPPIFEQALSSLVSEQSVVYFSSEDVRPTYKGVNDYNKWS